MMTHSYIPCPLSSSEDEDYDDCDGFFLESGHNYARQRSQKPEESKESIFLSALKNKELKTLEKMLADGFHVDQPLFGGWSALMHACSLGSFTLIKFLIEAHANVNFNQELYTPLMALCKSSSVNEDELLNCLNFLLEHEANVNATNRDATTALMNACSSGHLELVKRLLECDCDVNAQDSEGWSALFYAVDKDREDIIHELLNKKVRLDLIDRRKRSAYKLAFTKGLDHLYKLVCSKVERRRLLEQEQNLSVALPEKIFLDPVEELLQKLPSSNVKSTSGFSCDVGKLLTAIGLRHYIKLFEANGIQLNDFLLITDGQLKEMGVRFSLHRQHILKSLKKFHLHQWNKKSLGLKPRNEQMYLDDGIKVMCNVTKHLLILNATLKFVEECQPAPLRPEMIKLGESSMHQLNLIANELKAIQSHTKKLALTEKMETVDLIKLKTTPSLCQKYSFSIMLTTVCVGFVLWKNKVTLNKFLPC